MARHIDRKQCPVCNKWFVAKRRTTCTPVCHEKHAVIRAEKAKQKFYNDFLPADAEENIQGFWVPSVAEIAAATRLANPGKLTEYT